MIQSALNVLAVYRVRNDGVLKGLRRWPKAIDKWAYLGKGSG